MTHADQPVLYVITCGAGPAGQVTRLISEARARGWDPYLIATPAALDFLNMQELEEQTGHPVRSEYRKPGNTASGRSLPKYYSCCFAVCDCAAAQRGSVVRCDGYVVSPPSGRRGSCGEGCQAGAVVVPAGAGLMPSAPC